MALLHVRPGRASQRQRRRTLAGLAIAIGAAVLALGPFLTLRGHNTGVPLPYLALYYLFPGFQSMRAPARFGLMAVPALSILVAYGILILRQRWQGRRIPRLAPWLVVGLLLIELLRNPIPMKPVPEAFDRATIDLLSRANGALIWLPFAESEMENGFLEAGRMLQNAR